MATSWVVFDLLDNIHCKFYYPVHSVAAPCVSEKNYHILEFVCGRILLQMFTIEK